MIRSERKQVSKLPAIEVRRVPKDGLASEQKLVDKYADDSIVSKPYPLDRVTQMSWQISQIPVRNSALAFRSP